MKKCMLCGASANQEAPTCEACGEATWGDATEKATQVASLATPEPADGAPVTTDEPFAEPTEETSNADRRGKGRRNR